MVAVYELLSLPVVLFALVLIAGKMHPQTVPLATPLSPDLLGGTGRNVMGSDEG